MLFLLLILYACKDLFFISLSHAAVCSVAVVSPRLQLGIQWQAFPLALCGYRILSQRVVASKAHMLCTVLCAQRVCWVLAAGLHLFFLLPNVRKSDYFLFHSVELYPRNPSIPMLQVFQASVQSLLCPEQDTTVFLFHWTPTDEWVFSWITCALGALDWCILGGKTSNPLSHFFVKKAKCRESQSV